MKLKTTTTTKEIVQDQFRAPKQSGFGGRKHIKQHK